jgi:hypothetical protein
MRSRPVEIGHIPIEYALKLHFVENKQVVKAFLSHAPQKAFADRIGSGSVIRRSEHFNGTRRCHSGETGPKLAIVITDQIFRCLPIRGSFSQLLRDPGIGWRPCHADMDYPSCLEFDKEEREERSKEEISHLQEIAGPDICRMIVQKGRPFLSSRSACANRSHVLLNGSLAYMNAEF